MKGWRTHLMTMTTKKEKVRAQVKSRFYYMFWGTATVAVVTGQIYVGNGFRRMAESVQRVLDAPLMIEIPDLYPPEFFNPKYPIGPGYGGGFDPKAIPMIIQ